MVPIIVDLDVFVRLGTHHLMEVVLYQHKDVLAILKERFIRYLPHINFSRLLLLNKIGLDTSILQFIHNDLFCKMLRAISEPFQFIFFSSLFQSGESFKNGPCSKCLCFEDRLLCAQSCNIEDCPKVMLPAFNHLIRASITLT